MNFGVNAQPGGPGHQDMLSELGAGLWLFLTAPSLPVAREELAWAGFTPVAFWQRSVFISELPNLIPI